MKINKSLLGITYNHNTDNGLFALTMYHTAIAEYFKIFDVAANAIHEDITINGNTSSALHGNKITLETISNGFRDYLCWKADQEPINYAPAMYFHVFPNENASIIIPIEPTEGQISEIVTFTLEEIQVITEALKNAVQSAERTLRPKNESLFNNLVNICGSFDNFLTAYMEQENKA